MDSLDITSDEQKLWDLLISEDTINITKDRTFLIWLISNKKFKQALFSRFSFHGYNSVFNFILTLLTEEEFYIFIDKYTLDLIDHLNEKVTAIHSILLNQNPVIDQILKHSPFADYVVSSFSDFSCFIEDLPDSRAISLFENIMHNNPEKITLLTQLSPKNQYAVIKSMGVYHFYDVNLVYPIFEYLDNEVITLLISEKPFDDYFVNLSIDQIMSFIHSGLVLPYAFSFKENFIKKINTIYDPNVYRILQQKIINTSYDNFRRMRSKHLSLCLQYFEEQHIKYDDIDLNPYYGSSTILPSSVYDDIYDDEKLELAREQFYDRQVDQIMRCNGLLPEYESIYITGNINIADIDKNYYLKTQLEQWFKCNQDKQVLYSILSRATTKRLQEILIDRFFKDIPYNFLINLNNVIRFFSNIDWNLLHMNDEELKNLSDRLRRYRKIINFNDLSRTEQISFYHEFDRHTDYQAMFYDDFNLARRTAYEDMNNKVFNPKTHNSLLNHQLSKQYGIDIYELKGEPFYGYIHVSKIRRSEELNGTDHDRVSLFLNEPLEDIENPIGSSISLIGYLKLNTVRKVKDYTAFGYSYLIPERIAHVYHADSYSSFRRTGTGTRKINEIYTAYDLLKKTRRYSEILYQEVNNSLLDEDVLKNYDPLRPSYLYCYDEVTSIDVAIASQRKLSILLVHTDCYEQELEHYNDYNYDNEYITTLGEIYKIKTYRKM